jgi:hypothetical protein
MAIGQQFWVAMDGSPDAEPYDTVMESIAPTEKLCRERLAETDIFKKWGESYFHPEVKILILKGGMR